jgi:L-lactate utilization protein LutC
MANKKIDKNEREIDSFQQRNLKELFGSEAKKLEFEKSMKENVRNQMGAFGHIRWLMDKNEIKTSSTALEKKIQELREEQQAKISETAEVVDQLKSSYD